MTVTAEHIRIARLYQANYNTVHGHLIPSEIGLARVMRVNRKSLVALKLTGQRAGCTDEQNALKQELIDILDEIQDMQHFALLQGGLAGEMNSNIVKLALGKHGYSDKVDNTLGNPDGTPMDTNWTVKVVRPGDANA